MERLLKQIGSFMSDIADDFKIVVVEAIRSLCLKFPQKCARPVAGALGCGLERCSSAWGFSG